ncbi:MAG: hypothetical protein RBS81_10595 [Tenuifilaceae bacterium]|jgi:transposase|nr:hypothetical protein [Tenuifilaceae bacterium]
MVNIVFKELSSIEPSLFPQNILAKIAPNHPVRLVNEDVDSLDLSAILSKYPGEEASNFLPRMLIKQIVGAILSRSLPTSTRIITPF